MNILSLPIEHGLASLFRLPGYDHSLANRIFATATAGDILAMYVCEHVPDHWFDPSQIRTNLALLAALGRGARMVYLHPSEALCRRIAPMFYGRTAWDRPIDPQGMAVDHQRFIRRLKFIIERQCLQVDPGVLDNMITLEHECPMACMPKTKYMLAVTGCGSDKRREFSVGSILQGCSPLSGGNLVAYDYRVTRVLSAGLEEALNSAVPNRSDGAFAKICDLFFTLPTSA